MQVTESSLQLSDPSVMNEKRPKVRYMAGDGVLFQQTLDHWSPQSIFIVVKCQCFYGNFVGFVIFNFFLLKRSFEGTF